MKNTNLETIRTIAKRIELQDSEYLKIETSTRIMEFGRKDVEIILKLLEEYDILSNNKNGAQE